MTWKRLRIFFFGCLAASALCTCSDKEGGWQLTLAAAGTYASPRAIDLNGDGVKDIVLGAGGDAEWQGSENGVLAINGRDGRLLWKAPCRNQIVGSPLFLPINDDETPDVIIGGRSAQLLALDGRSGRLIWEHLPHREEYDYQRDTTLLNFFTPQRIADQDGDGVDDFVISYGGYVAAQADDPERPAGYLAVFSSASGQLLCRAPMPDGRETYLSPVLLPGGDALLVLFGTGGETIPGNLYGTPLDDLFDNRIDRAVLLARGKEKGFIAPPVLADLNGDAAPDIVVNAYEGYTLAIDGRSYAQLWKVEAGEGYETHSQPAAGYFNEDQTPDFFVHFSSGRWPNSAGGTQLLIDGKTGHTTAVGSLGSLQMSSPIVLPRRNGPDRVLLAINDRRTTGDPIESGLPGKRYETAIVNFDFDPPRHTILKQKSGINLGSTLLIDDLNGNRLLELIYCFNLNPYDIKTFGGLQVECQSLPETIPGRLPWNQYMGAQYNSTFPDQKKLDKK